MKLRWIKGGEARLVALEGDRISVLSTTASAPGSRPEALIESGATIRIKVARCRKQDDGFLIDGRLIDTTRESRQELERTRAP